MSPFMKVYCQVLALLFVIASLLSFLVSSNKTGVLCIVTVLGIALIARIVMYLNSK